MSDSEKIVVTLLGVIVCAPIVLIAILIEKAAYKLCEMGNKK